MNKTLPVVFLAIAVGLVLTASRAEASPIQAYDNTGSRTGAISGGDLNFNMGHEFTVTGTGIDVTSLGVYDDGGHTLSVSHDVDLFSIPAFGATSGTLMASVTVAAGQSSPSDFVFAPLGSPLHLVDGLYAVIAYNLDPTSGTDPYGDGGGVPDGVSTPNILDDTYASFRFDPYAVGGGPSPNFPNSGDGNFHSTAALLYTLPVPEPCSAVLLGLGVLGFCVAACRRRRSGR